MPWKTVNKVERKLDLVCQMQRGGSTVTELCRRFQISRKTAYKWLGRYRLHRLQGLHDRSRKPHRVPGRTNLRWLERLRDLRLKRRTWGARKLRSRLQSEFGSQTLPSTAAISRWLQRWGMTVSRPRRKKGPKLTRRPVRPARSCNDLWTVDFKGWFATGDGCRVHPDGSRFTQSVWFANWAIATFQFRTNPPGICEDFQALWPAQAYSLR